MDESGGLENRSPSRDRGFESHPLRQHLEYNKRQDGEVAEWSKATVC